MDISTVVEQYIDSVAYAVGYDISNTDDRNYLSNLISAGVQDLCDAGVNESTITTNKLTLTTLIIFVTDNLNMSPGQFSMSSLYIYNVTKLRLIKDESE